MARRAGIDPELFRDVLRDENFFFATLFNCPTIIGAVPIDPSRTEVFLPA